MHARKMSAVGLVLLAEGAALASGCRAAEKLADFGVKGSDVPCCDHTMVEAIVWSGRDSLMTVEDIAAYCGPVLWFSPDEPLLGETRGKNITLPEPFPFEDAPGTPVVYYRLRKVMVAGRSTESAYRSDPADRGASIVDLSMAGAFELDYFFYYHAEAGFGGHEHDVESAEFKVLVWKRPQCTECPYALVVSRVVGKAHGVLWYDNTLSLDEYARFPLHLLVEEGKHATCTDKNGDGYFTPGYDVNRRTNDAWGVRDVLRSGALFTGNYESWMTKVRGPDHRVLPPLPPDSPHRDKFLERGVYGLNNAVYELRPFPSAEKADADLVPFIADKGDPDWPSLTPEATLAGVIEWTSAESFVKSVSVSLLADGDLGFSVTFPFFIVKNFEDPVAGGYLVHRVYLKDKHMRDVGYMLLYTASASRWVDGYFGAGIEWDEYEVTVDDETSISSSRDMVVETGIRFRANIRHSPLGFMSFLTDFWGIRAGVKNYGFFEIERLTYVLEIGSGVW